MKRKKEQPVLNLKKANYLVRSSAGRSMTYPDIKRQAVVLGMPFPDVVGSTIFGLMSYIDNSPNVPDPSLVDKFDEWVEKHFDEIGIPANDPIRSPYLRLGFIGDEVDPETGEVKKRRKRIPGIKKPKEKKPKREKDENGRVKGTKKSYTYELAQKGRNLEQTTRRVFKKFPDANERSIALWYRAAIREIKKK